MATLPTGTFGHVDTVDQLLDRESSVLLSYLAKGDIDPIMFHQPNMASYSGTNAGPLPDAAFKVGGTITGSVAIGTVGADGSTWKQVN